MEWNPAAAIPSPLKIQEAKSTTMTGSNGDVLSAQIKECGDKVRELKSKKAEKVKTESK